MGSAKTAKAAKSAAPSTSSATTSTGTGTMGTIDTTLLHRAIHALLKHDETSKSSSKDLLESDTDIQVQFSLLRIPGNASPKPIRLDIPHALVKIGGSSSNNNDNNMQVDDDDNYLSPPEICLIVKDSIKPQIQSLLARFADSNSHSPNVFTCIKKVLTLSSLRTKHKTFAQKRDLLSRFDLFLADDRILPMLTKALGSKFFEKKRQPVPICLTRNIRSMEDGVGGLEGDDGGGEVDGGLVSRLEKILNGTYMYLSAGTCVTIKAGSTAMPPKKLISNIESIISQAPSKIPKKWSNIRSISIKTADSVALPIYNKTPEELAELVYLARQTKGGNSSSTPSKNKEEEEVAAAAEAVENKKKKRKELVASTPLARALKKQKSVEKKVVVVDKEEEEEVEEEEEETVPKKKKSKKAAVVKDDVDATNDAATTNPEEKKKTAKKTPSSKNKKKESSSSAKKEAVSSSPSSSEPASFIASKKFTGSKAGYVFKKDKQGLGYYKDVLPVVNQAWLSSLGSSRGGGGGGGGSKKGGRGVSNTPAKRRKGGSRRSF